MACFGNRMGCPFCCGGRRSNRTCNQASRQRRGLAAARQEGLVSPQTREYTNKQMRGVAPQQEGFVPAQARECTRRTTGEELYAGPACSVEMETCCDAYCGCREFPAAARDPFWPSFARPRWLSCEELYSQCR